MHLITPDKFHDECAVFGIYGHKEAANLTYLGLYALQHRGQEGSGIVSSDGDHFYTEKGMGLVADIYTKSVLKRLPGNMAIGHNRYSTAGGNNLKNVQPLTVNFAFGNLALAHNGNLINATMLRHELEAYGAIFQSTTDSEVIIHLIAHSRVDPLLARILDALSQWMVASETCAFDLINAEYVRDVEPGELIVLDEKGLTSHRPFVDTQPAKCVFEYVYFSRPDSKIYGGHTVYATRKALGRQLAKEAPVDADVVIPVPDSGVPAALGFSEGSGIPFETGLIRNHYVGRTFIEPEQSIRHFGVKVKLNAVPEILKGKRVVVIDDSLVRGTTSRKIVKMLRQAGAKEVHMRISSPPIVSPCFYGIDTPTKRELIASSHNTQEIKKYITADSLAYLSLEGMLNAAPARSEEYCTACFTDKYPFPFTKSEELQLGLSKSRLPWKFIARQKIRVLGYNGRSF